MMTHFTRDNHEWFDKFKRRFSKSLHMVVCPYCSYSIVEIGWSKHEKVISLDSSDLRQQIVCNTIQQKEELKARYG